MMFNQQKGNQVVEHYGNSNSVAFTCFLKALESFLFLLLCILLPDEDIDIINVVGSIYEL